MEYFIIVWYNIYTSLKIKNVVKVKLPLSVNFTFIPIVFDSLSARTSISTLPCLLCIFNVGHYASWVSVPWVFCFQYSCFCVLPKSFISVFCCPWDDLWASFVAFQLAVYLPKMYLPTGFFIPHNICSLILILGTCLAFVGVMGCLYRKSKN